MRGEVLRLTLELPGGSLVVWLLGFGAFTVMVCVQPLVRELTSQKDLVHKKIQDTQLSQTLT